MSQIIRDTMPFPRQLATKISSYLATSSKFPVEREYWYGDDRAASVPAIEGRRRGRFPPENVQPIPDILTIS